MELSPKEQAQVNLDEPIGEIMLGSVNPVGLSQTEFRSSPDLLFHGALQDFSFSQYFNYEGFNNPGSHTIGQGFYATSERNDAFLYATRRSPFVQGQVVVEVLPYQAKMFDFRSLQDVRRNAPVPYALVSEYRDFCQEKFHKRFDGYDIEGDVSFINTSEFGDERTKRVVRFSRYNNLRRYIAVLNTFTDNKAIDLREMLSLIGQAYQSEFASDLISDFMLSKDYDGLIYIEGGDHPDHKNPVSYVFFNLKKVGNYETWNPLE